MLIYTAIDNVHLPLTKGKAINIRLAEPIGRLYSLLLTHCRESWPELNLVDDMSMEDGTPFHGHRVAKSLNYIRKDGIHYGCASNKKLQVDSFAFISTGISRSPVQIHSLFLIEIDGKPPQVAVLICQMVSDAAMPTFPWDL